MNLNSGKHGMSLLRSSGDSIRSDRAGRTPGRYIATELRLELGRYVATELWLELGLGCYAETGQCVCVVITQRSSLVSLVNVNLKVEEVPIMSLFSLHKDNSAKNFLFSSSSKSTTKKQISNVYLVSVYTVRGDAKVF
ncbi:hypothetical protein F2Q69_00007481 [Brassica cretica]|uniref:Uncharacterized protein n=1 Tax=Brassica cretica TaxID=69181 RepID=A0A8S9NRK9_BRACR|nr:hypothetical protein F2Q69_00007481 [Brassica cretica]